MERNAEATFISILLMMVEFCFNISNEKFFLDAEV
jgi:hypothetical protein